jgi:hypothetical protein
LYHITLVVIQSVFRFFILDNRVLLLLLFAYSAAGPSSFSLQPINSVLRLSPRLSAVVKMVLFCPHCANILLIEVGNTGLRFYCQTCPYVFKITQKIETRLPFTRKRPDDVLGGEEAWANAPKDKGAYLIFFFFFCFPPPIYSHVKTTYS